MNNNVAPSLIGLARPAAGHWAQKHVARPKSTGVYSGSSLNLFEDDPYDYQNSMASPHENADGLEITVLSSRKASVVVSTHAYAFEEFDGFDELAPMLDHVELNVEPPPIHIIPTSSIIELFEGVVQSVGDKEMDVVLRAKRDQSIPDHGMAIDLMFVQPQDLPLVKSGAVFYLTMFRETTGRTVRNVEEIRFRRQPDWTPTMFRKLDELAAQL